MNPSNTKRPPKPTAPRPAPDQIDAAAQANRLLNEAAQLLHQHRPGEAATRLEEAQRLAPDNVLVAINLGGAYIMQGKYRRAVPILEEAARLEPDNPMVWTNLAAAYLGRLELSTPDVQDRAITAFTRALHIDPQTPHIDYNLGLIYQTRGDVARARIHFARALEVNPNDRDARSWLTRLSQPTPGAEANTGHD